MATSPPKLAPGARWLTIREVADLYKVSVDTVRRWEHAGIGPRPERFGRTVRYRSSDVEIETDAA